MNNGLIAYIADKTPYGFRDIAQIEDEMILSPSYYGSGYYALEESDKNDEKLAEIFNKCIGLKGRMPDLQTLADEVWEHNDDLLHEMSVVSVVEEYYQNGIDLEEEVTEKELSEDIDSYHTSCIQMYAESNMLDECYEINKYATKNGISYVVEADSDVYELAVANLNIDIEKDILMNPAQGIMFEELLMEDENDEEILVNYGRFLMHYRARG